MDRTLELFATAPRGVASVLAEELRALGAGEVTERPAGVGFRGDLALAYRVCLWSRCAGRVLLPLKRFEAEDGDALYQGVKAIDWSDHLDPDATLAVDFTSRRSALDHTAFGARRVKDAIVDQFRERFGRRPSVDTEAPDLRINLHLQRDRATVAIDLSGASLHKRGYRCRTVAAPLKEHLAAALLLRAGWPRVAEEGGCLVDPMCGSGTLPIEAALMAADIAPGLLRERFGFHGWKGHDAALWEALLEEARERRERGLERVPPIFGYDLDETNLAAARANVEAAGVDEVVRLARRDVAELAPPPGCGGGLVVVNPPYGERLGERERLGGLYATLGARLKTHFRGWRAALFTGNPELARHLGIRSRRGHPFYNGALECRLLRYEIEPDHFHTGRPGMPAPLAPEALGPGAGMLANRLRKNLRELGRWARRNDVTCYRLYDADLPEYAVAVDLYQTDAGPKVLVQEYEAPATIDRARARQRLREVVTVVPEVTGVAPEALFFKVRRRQKGRAQYDKLGESGRFFEVREGACRFLVNFEDYLDTGLFLDHRQTRARVAELAQGCDMLNLFAYTATATVHAALGGARSTTTVDLSRTYLDWGRRNMALNGLEIDGHRHTFIQADCLQWLEEAARRGGRRFGLIFLDPPTFSTSKRMAESFDVQRDHPRIIEQAMALLAPEGVLLFSNNKRKFRMEAQVRERFRVEEISRRTLPRDFARNPHIHNAWEIRHR